MATKKISIKRMSFRHPDIRICHKDIICAKVKSCPAKVFLIEARDKYGCLVFIKAYANDATEGKHDFFQNETSFEDIINTSVASSYVAKSYLGNARITISYELDGIKIHRERLTGIVLDWYNGTLYDVLQKKVLKIDYGTTPMEKPRDINKEIGRAHV